MSEGNSSHLVPVHGGLSEPVDRTVPLNQRTVFQAEADALPSVVVTAADLSTVYRIADGALSPLDGPMKRSEFQQVLDDSVLIRDGQRYAWTIPLSLPVTDTEAGAISEGGSVAIRTEDGALVAIVDDAEVFDWDKGSGHDFFLTLMMYSESTFSPFGMVSGFSSRNVAHFLDPFD